jgi:hypothetical protein
MTRVQVVGKTSREVYGVEPPLYFDEYLVAGHYGRPNRFETYFVATDRHFSISVAPLGSGFFATIFTDIIEKKTTGGTARTA